MIGVVYVILVLVIPFTVYCAQNDAVFANGFRTSYGCNSAE